MAYIQKENDIAIFDETKTKTNPAAPDWKGSAFIGGETYQVAFWFKSETMLRGKIELKRANYAAAQGENPPAPAPAAAPVQTDLEDEIPF
jgi:hypothetical protein